MKFPSIYKYVTDKDPLLTSNEHSRKQHHIPEIIGEYGGGVMAGMKSRKHVLYLMAGCLYEAQKSASSILKNPDKGKKSISKEDLIAFEAYAKSIGVSDLGYTKVKRKHIFENEAILFEYAIVLSIKMKKEAIKTTPSKYAIKEIFSTYYELGVVVNKLSKFLRKKGYKAMAGPAIGGAVSYVPLAQDAGLGVIGKHGLLISDKDYGPSLRLSAVYTDIENLPVNQENPHMWVKSFCDKCNKCVTSCPAGAIYDQAIVTKEDDKGYSCIDMRKCATPFANDYGCTVCIKSCTFFNSDYKKIKKGFLKTLEKN